jgi:predicted PurR-regulated permease PerM
MTTETSPQRNFAVNQPLEASIQIGLAALLVFGCLEILRPFIPLIMWGGIIAIACHPTFLKFERVLKGRRNLAAILWTLLLLAVLILPMALLAENLVQGMQPIIERFHNGTVVLPPPPPAVAHWPLIGPPLARTWEAASANLGDTLIRFKPQIKAALPALLSASTSLGSTLLQFLASILLAGVILANAQAAYNLTRSLAIRLFGDQGPDYQKLVGATIRSVTFGVLGVAVIQTAFAAAGFFLAGLPGASIWSVIFLAAAVLQFGVLVLVPAVVYVFAVASTTKATIFLVWCLFVGLMDNVLKPILLGRGASVPILVVFLGVLGGFFAMGIVGLFVGAVVLSVGYKLFLAWIHSGVAPASPAPASQ